MKTKLNKQGLEQHSARLRHTLEVARLANFEYVEGSKNKYGGFFTVFQLEQIVNKLKKLELVEQELRIIKDERERAKGR